MPWTRLLTILILPFLLLSCQKQEPETREKMLSRGFDMMDQGHYDQAVDYFEKLAQKDTHYHVKLAWASAYAGRAGVKIENIYAYALAAKKPLPEIQFQGLRFDKQTQLMLTSIDGFLQQWQKIPEITLAGREDLSAALEILSEKEVPGVSLYSAALRIVLLKSYAQEGLKNWEIKSQGPLCGRFLRHFFSWAQRILESLSDLTFDLENSFPKQAETYQQNRASLDALLTQAKRLSLPKEDQCF